LDNLDIGPSACDSFVQDDDDDWLCSSEHNDEPFPNEEFTDELPEVQAEPRQLQHYTAQQWLEKIEEALMNVMILYASHSNLLFTTSTTHSHSRCT
jgi:hypothetical protein